MHERFPLYCTHLIGGDEADAPLECRLPVRGLVSETDSCPAHWCRFCSPAHCEMETYLAHRELRRWTFEGYDDA